MMYFILLVVGLLALSLAMAWRNKCKTKTSSSSSSSLRICFLHPDLGIGGAENLIVNAACVLQSHGHTIHIYTSHHDVNHCFEETREDGPLSKCITVYGDWLPRNIAGRGYAFCAWVRMLFVTLAVLYNEPYTDVFFLDQISIPIPILKCITGIPILFYCHFPDRLLCTARSTFWKKLYRMPLDYLEESSTAAASLILVNSTFTANIVKETFPSLSNQTLHVLYPPVNVQEMNTNIDAIKQDEIEDNEVIFVSLNRYERKKNIALAITSFAHLKNQMTLVRNCCTVRLIIAGGYDAQNDENIAHYKELEKLVEEHDVDGHVEFLRSISNDEKVSLILKATAIVYTPSNEHFGIVPVEAMCAGTPVIAVNSGGPKESIVHGCTGYLCEPTAEAFATAMSTLLEMPLAERQEMSQAGRVRVQEQFSLHSFGKILNEHVFNLSMNHNE